MKKNAIKVLYAMSKFAFRIWLLTMLTSQFVMAVNSSGQNLEDVYLTLHLKEKKVKEIIDAIEKRTDYTFFYNRDLRELRQRIDVVADNENMKNILIDISKQTGFSFKRVNQNIAIKINNKQEVITEGSGFLYDKVISGIITDAETGEPLIGATVQVKGTTIGTVTNANGSFSFEVPDNTETLMISYLGYSTKEISLNSQTVVNILLNKNLTELDEVVVTALDMSDSKRKLGYSLTNLDSKEVSTIKNTNIKTSLLGKISGVNVSPVRNGVGGSQRIIIRGISSISRENQPLWVIDGVPVISDSYGNTTAGGGIDYGDPLSGIDPDNIESISVLKSNAAAALYGSSAANGVILVNTKKGRQTEGLSIDVNSSIMFDKPRDYTDWQYDYGQGSEGRIPSSADEALAWGDKNWGPKFNGQTGVQFDGVERPYKAYPDNFKEYYRTAFTSVNSLGISGGGEIYQFRVSASHQDSKDIVPNSKYQRNTLGVNAGTKLKFAEIDIRVNYFNEVGKNRTRVGGNYQNPHLGFFAVPVSLDINNIKPGYYDDLVETEMTFGSHPSQTNPFFVANRIKQQDRKNNLIGNFMIKIPLYNGLYVKSRILQNYIAFRNQRAYGTGIAWNPQGGGIDEDWNERLQSNYEGMIGFENSFNAISINMFAGANKQYILRRGVSVEGNPFVSPGIYSINNLENRQVSSQYSEEQTNSVFGSVQLGWINKIYLTVTGRNDWFSTLADGNNSLFYPSVSLSILPKDWLMKGDVFTINQTRLSFARVSGATSPYQLDLGYSLDSENYGGNPIQRINTSRIPNKDLQPFLSTEYEAGINFGFLSDLLTLDFVYYDKMIENDIVSTSVSPTTGFSSAVLNVGKVTNKGIETTLSGYLVNNNELTIQFSGNFSFNKNNVESLGDDVETISLQRAKYSNSAYVHIDEGEPYGTIRGTTFMRDDQGNLVYDEDGYNIIDNESKILGYGIYDKLFGLSFNVSYKNFSFYTLFDGKFGADIFSETSKLAISNGKHKMTLNGRENGLTVNGVDEDGNSLSVNIPASDVEYYYSRYASADEVHVQSADFIKIREIAVGYSIPTKGFINVIKSAQIQFTVNNVATLFTNAENIDPESNLTSSDVQGFETFGYPSVTRMGFNLNLKF